jgi:DNA-binding SARP family transcriptional activator
MAFVKTSPGGSAVHVEDALATGGTPSMRLSMLGGFELSSGGDVYALPLAVQRVAAFVALQARPVQRVYVAGRLWLNTSEQRAQAALRTTLWRARVPAGELLSASTTHLRLGDAVRVDLHDILSCAQRVLRQPESHILDDLACLMDSGDLLPDWYDEWLILERERVRQLRCLALETLCDRFRCRGWHAQATQAGLAAVAAEPLRESAHRALIRVHLAEGNRFDAVRQYRILATLLRRELGVLPSSATAALLRRSSGR